MSRTLMLVFIEAWTSTWNAWSAVSLCRSIRMPLAWSTTAREFSAAWRLAARFRAWREHRLIIDVPGCQRPAGAAVQGATGVPRIDESAGGYFRGLLGVVGDQ